MLRTKAIANENSSKTKACLCIEVTDQMHTLDTKPARYAPLFCKPAPDNMNCKARHGNLQMFKKNLRP